MSHNLFLSFDCSGETNHQVYVGSQLNLANDLQRDKLPFAGLPGECRNFEPQIDRYVDDHPSAGVSSGLGPLFIVVHRRLSAVFNFCPDSFADPTIFDAMNRPQLLSLRLTRKRRTERR